VPLRGRDWANLIYALDDAGGVWFYRDTKKKWVRVPDDRE
jgi:hypothetical protein